MTDVLVAYYLKESMSTKIDGRSLSGNMHQQDEYYFAA
jgi:hypothetical protein